MLTRCHTCIQMGLQASIYFDAWNFSTSRQKTLTITIPHWPHTSASHLYSCIPLTLGFYGSIHNMNNPNLSIVILMIGIKNGKKEANQWIGVLVNRVNILNISMAALQLMSFRILCEHYFAEQKVKSFGVVVFSFYIVIIFHDKLSHLELTMAPSHSARGGGESLLREKRFFH